jgi:hypothetical protein
MVGHFSGNGVYQDLTWPHHFLASRTVLTNNHSMRRVIVIARTCVLFVVSAQAVLVLNFVPPRQKLTPKPSAPCYAFMLDGDVWTVCDGKREKISLKEKGVSFSISPDGSTFAFISEERTSGQSKRPLSELVEVDLKSFKTKVTDTEFNHLRPTCGTILGYQAGSWTATDILRESVVNISSQHAFACDSDRHTILVLDNVNFESARMTLQVNGKETDARTVFLNGGREFGVGPNGKYIAYFRGDSGKTQLCSQLVGSVEECVGDFNEVGFDGASVSDTGAVLHAGDTGEGCFYRDMSHYAKKPLRDYTEGDVCVGVYLWSPGMSDPLLIENLGRYPQWITPQDSIALHEWASKTGFPLPQ